MTTPLYSIEDLGDECRKAAREVVVGTMRAVGNAVDNPIGCIAAPVVLPPVAIGGAYILSKIDSAQAESDKMRRELSAPDVNLHRCEDDQTSNQGAVFYENYL